MLNIISHPLVRHKLTIVRKKETNTKDFVASLDEIAGLLAYEITRNIPLKEIEIETPLAKCLKYEIATRIVLVPVLRAGLGMVTGIRNLIPNAQVAHLGLYRNEETLQPHTYFAKFPTDIENAVCFILDPMLATGGTACAAISLLKERGVKSIKLVSLVAAPEGVQTVEQAHPDVDIYTVEVDTHLNEQGYIVPGLGDAGDRIFGTK